MKKSHLLLSLCAVLLVPAPAWAGKITLGSKLSTPADVVVAQGADTAFWPTSVEGHEIVVPEDGQIVAVRIRGSAMSEKGAPNDPATMIHFQSLMPAAPDGSRQVWLTSGAFHMPVDEPEMISKFEPVNLCVKAGGAFDFNTIGGFRWGGSFEAPLGGHYLNGTPWQIFAHQTGSKVAWFSKDQGTNNGQTLSPVPGPDARVGMGGVHQGLELLMQVVVATGEDRSEACGGPRRHPDGTLVRIGPAPMYMKVATAYGKPQKPYVPSTRRFRTAVYCGGEALESCDGVAKMLVGGREIARAKFSIPKMESDWIPMTLPRALERRLDQSRTRTLRTVFVLTTQFGTYKQPLTLQR